MRFEMRTVDGKSRSNFSNPGFRAIKGLCFGEWAVTAPCLSAKFPADHNLKQIDFLFHSQEHLLIRRYYSYLNHFTGFVIAVLIVCEQTINKPSPAIVKMPVSKIIGPISILYAKVSRNMVPMR